MRKILSILSITLLSATCKKTVFTLNGSQSYAPRGFKTIQWKQISGGQSNIDSANNLVTQVEVGSVGIYVFQLTCPFNPDTIRLKYYDTIVNYKDQSDSVKITVVK